MINEHLIIVYIKRKRLKGVFMKKLISLLMITAIIITLTACGSKNANDSEILTEPQTESVSEISEKESETFATVTAILDDSEAEKNTVSESMTAIETFEQDIDSQTAENEKSTNNTFGHTMFRIDEDSTYVLMQRGWKLLIGGENTDSATRQIEYFPAIIQYDNTKDNLTIVAEEGCETKDAFLENTQESYLEAYGNQFESINITSFKYCTIHGYDSFKIIADITVKGETFTMQHIITNDVNGKTYSWMLLDSDGQFADFELDHSIYYTTDSPSKPRVDISKNR